MIGIPLDTEGMYTLAMYSVLGIENTNVIWPGYSRLSNKSEKQIDTLWRAPCSCAALSKTLLPIIHHRYLTLIFNALR